MNASFPWLPFGIEAPGGARTGPLLLEGEEFQLVQDRVSSRAILLTLEGTDFARRMEEIAPDADHCERVGSLRFFDYDYLTITFVEDSWPIRVADIPKEAQPRSAPDLLRLARAIKELMETGDDYAWAEMIYFPEYGKCLPTQAAAKDEDRHVLAIMLLTGGVKDTSLSAAQIHSINTWISVEEILEYMDLLGFRLSKDGNSRREPPRAPKHFSLPGRPALEDFFREYVIDHFWQKDRYDALGVKPPGGVLLFGPPGTGKTFAVRALSNFLGWPVFDIDMGKVGSPYIHQTSVAIRNVFESAFKQAPSLILIDEVDALVGDRNLAGQDYKVEEISEFLRLIEKASDNGVIVFATTNRKEAIDDAIKRRGRFDHVLEVGYPDVDEIVIVVESLLSERPHVGGINYQSVAEKIVRRPMSDIAWVVNESARLAVKSGKEQIDDICLFQAISKLSLAE